MRKNKMNNNNNNNNNNEIINNFVNYINNNYVKCNNFKNAYENIEIDDYEIMVESFCEKYNYNVNYVYNLFSETYNK